MLPIRFHLGFMIASEFIGFAIGAIFVGTLWVSGLPGNQLWLTGFVMMASVGVGALLPRLFLRYVLPAKCSRADCGGSAYATGKSPIAYVCSRCNDETVTSVSETHGRRR